MRHPSMYVDNLPLDIGNDRLATAYRHQ